MKRSNFVKGIIVMSIICLIVLAVLMLSFVIDGCCYGYLIKVIVATFIMFAIIIVSGLYTLCD